MNATNATQKESRDLKRYRADAEKLCDRINKANDDIRDSLTLLKPTLELIKAHGGDVPGKVTSAARGLSDLGAIIAEFGVPDQA